MVRDSIDMNKMLSELEFILSKYSLSSDTKRMPIEIPNVGRDDLAYLFAELDYKGGVEVGVEQGLYSEVLCEANPQATVYGVDPWTAYHDYRYHVTQSKLDGFLEKTKIRMKPYDNYRIIRKFSLHAVDDFYDGSLDFVFIDGNHTLPFIIMDLIEWSKKVRVGGMVTGHDYRKSKRIRSQNHVVYAVQCYTQSYRIHPWFLFGRKGKVSGEVRDDARSWAWVKIR